MTTGPEAGSPDAHPVLEDVGAADVSISDAAGFLSPTRMFDEPGMEESDWPRDLDGPETLRMMGHLTDITFNVGGCLMGIRCQHAIPDAAKPEMYAIANLLLEASLKLRALTETPGREAGQPSPVHQARLDFPDGSPARRPAGAAPPATPRTATAPAARPPRPSP
jgi:hypothetical protein